MGSGLRGHMIDRNVLRLGGICGLLFVILFIPSYVSAPDTPSTTSSIQEVLDYFAAGQSGIVFLNGVLLIFASFFFLWSSGFCMPSCSTPSATDTLSGRSR